MVEDPVTSTLGLMPLANLKSRTIQYLIIWLIYSPRFSLSHLFHLAACIIFPLVCFPPKSHHFVYFDREGFFFLFLCFSPSVHFLFA